MMRRTLAFVLFGVVLAFGQRPPNTPAPPTPAPSPNEIRNIEVVVHVLFMNERHACEHITVMLESAYGGTVAQTFTNDEGKAVFKNVVPGSYIIRVRDMSIKETATGALRIEYERSHHEYIRVEPAGSAIEAAPAAAAVQIPNNALKEFDKGNRALADGQREQAIQHFQRAIELYPQFPMAYNNLAAVYMKSKDFAAARDALTKALAADPALSVTHANLVRVALLEHRFADAIPLAEKALAREPQNTEFLFLMCEAQFFSGNFDQAIVYARRVYGAPHQKFELAHILAGRALEAQHRLADARAEYAQLVKESPSAPEASEATKSLARLESAARPPSAPAAAK